MLTAEHEKKGRTLCIRSLLLLSHGTHNLADLCLARLAAHLQEHCPDHLFRYRRIFSNLLFKILLGEIIADQRPDNTAGNKP